jgi:demethylmenaquinone methyltransferase / 2-methoxy-6-polyprenyl-1,4-benzoquinol methylase
MRSTSKGGMKATSSILFAGLARSYERALDYATLFQDRRWKSWAIQKLEAGADDVVLDVGSGTLVLEERLAGKGCSFVALDLAPEMIRVGQRKKMGNVSLMLNADAEFLPFGDGTFDSVVSCYVPKYVDVGRFAKELARVTRPGGTAVLYDFAKPVGPLAPLIELYIQGGLRVAGFALDLLGRDEAFTFRNLPWIVDRTSWDREIEGAMEQSGFESVAAERLTGGVVFAYCGRRSKDGTFPKVGIGSRD